MKMTLDFDRWDYLATRLLLVGTLLVIAGVALVAALAALAEALRRGREIEADVEGLV